MRMLALLCVLIGTPVAAFDIDYAALFRAHPGDVRQVNETLRVLELEGPVIVNERTDDEGRVSYVGIDRSEFGAAGCLFRILFELVAATRLCEGLLEPGEIARLEANLTQSAQFVAANTFPIVPPDEVPPRLRARLNGFIDILRAKDEAICPLPGDDVPDFVKLARRLARQEVQEGLKQVYSLPRLPVTNPCL